MNSHYLEGINLESILIISRLTEAMQLHYLGPRIPLLGEEKVNYSGSESVH